MVWCLFLSVVGQYQIEERFYTIRHRLVRARIHHAQAIFDAYATDSQVTRYLGWKPHPSIEETIRFLSLVEKDWDDGKGYAFIIFSKLEPDDLLGMIHIHEHHDALSYGYVLKREAWGKGIASEVLNALVDHGLSHPKIHRVFAFCDYENRASARVMEKAKLKLEGLHEHYFVHPNISDEPRDCLMYAKSQVP